ncbi:MAG: glycosyltransferase family 2 protein [Pseudomonadota bacterium]
MAQSSSPLDVSVIVTAKDASQTIAHAIETALAQSCVSEVVVVDDGSTDDTAKVVEQTDDDSGRLKLIRLAQNRGPAHGRNVALEASTAPLVCILDADDFMAHDRLVKMLQLADEDWDFLADDIIFTEGPDDLKGYDRLFDHDLTLPKVITLSDMILGNMPRKDRHRRETGFVKPIMRRDFLEKHKLRYDEDLKLGEDVLFYATALLEGARFKLVEACGYYAVERADSLSSRHGTDDLTRLANALQRFEGRVSSLGQPAESVTTYRRNIQKRGALRAALDAKRAEGWIGFAKACKDAGPDAGYVVRELVTDKISTLVRGR